MRWRRGSDVLEKKHSTTVGSVKPLITNATHDSESDAAYIVAKRHKPVPTRHLTAMDPYSAGDFFLIPSQRRIARIINAAPADMKK